MKTKKMTSKYWNTLSEGSRKRALTAVFPNLQFTVEMMLDEKPDTSNDLWRVVFKWVRIPEDNSHYKTYVNKTYYP